jgi:hypothetical protein
MGRGILSAGEPDVAIAPSLIPDPPGEVMPTRPVMRSRPKQRSQPRAERRGIAGSRPRGSRRTTASSRLVAGLSANAFLTLRVNDFVSKRRAPLPESRPFWWKRSSRWRHWRWTRPAKTRGVAAANTSITALTPGPCGRRPPWRSRCSDRRQVPADRIQSPWHGCRIFHKPGRGPPRLRRFCCRH